ncbi:right-handed parallel beta-helix repeat-containing protein [Bacteroidia bacterium]|nr:right-handed parallel beta-helix repeat-containing protein [Bacteroidia bacterium]MDA9213782.1 right-handed parallel beta-helix repeat-containing protein [Bacteroidia bacterium]
MRFKRNTKKQSVQIFVLLAFGIFALESLGYIKYQQHLFTWVKQTFEYDYFNSSIRRDAIGEKYGTAPSDTLKVDMEAGAFVALSDEWNSYFKNKQRIDQQPWLESKNNYSGRVKLISQKGEKWHRAKIGMMGMNRDHHPSLDRFSMKVKLKGDHRLFGKKSFRLLLPETRGYFIDDLANRLFSELYSGMQIRYKPVVVVFRKNKAVHMLLEEKLDKFFIESNQRRESYLFETGFMGPLRQIPGLEEMNISFELNSSLKDSLKNARFESLVLSGFQQNPELIFKMVDYKKFIGAMAIGTVFGSWHHLIDINLHWYYNPVNHQLEPTVREVGMYTDLNVNVPFEKMNVDQITDVLFPNKEGFFGHEYIKWLKAQDPDFESRLKFEINRVAIMTGQALTNFSVPQLLLGEPQKKEFDVFIERLQRRIEFYSQGKFIFPKEKEKDVVIWDGKIEIRSKVVIPENQTLILKPGTNIQFSEKGKILINGRLIADGNKKQPIVLYSLDKRSGSLFIESSDTQKLTHVYFKYLRNWSESFWQTPSSITVHRTPHIIFSNCSFIGNQKGDDFVNLFDCPSFDFTHCTFQEILSDALDSDFSNGRVSECRFLDVGNDGIDGSGSKIRINDCEFNRIGDKAISAGERSNFKVDNCRIEKAAIGLVSKDQSQLYSSQTQYGEVDLDIAVFQKKPEYGPSSFSSKQKISGFNYLIEHKSKIQSEGEKLRFSEDVRNKLYGADYGRATIK